MPTEILVFVPGTLGSELWDGNEKVWPGTLIEGLSGYSQKRFDQLLKPGLVPKDIVRSAVGGLVGVYNDWVKAFEAIVRNGLALFREKPVGGRPKTLFLFPYDWRVDLLKTTDELAAFLDNIVTATPDVDMKLVCHSMGGVIARYYLESGKYSARPAFSKISLLATFGTPHHGAPVAFAGVVGKHKTAFLSQAQTRTLANHPDYPSLYQLFPVVSQSCIWSKDPKFKLQDFPADDPTLIAHFNLVPTSIKAWKDVRAGLTGKRPPNVRYFFIIGSRQETMVRFRWQPPSVNPPIAARLEVEEIDDAGDGTVPLPGAMDTGTQSQFVGKTHASLLESQPARATLAELLGGTTLFAAAVTITVTVRDLVVSTKDPVRALVEFEPSVDQFKGTLTFERANIVEGAPEGTVPAFVAFTGAKPIGLELKGIGFTHVNLQAPPITISGVYRPVITASDGAVTRGSSFAVQKEAS